MSSNLTKDARMNFLAQGRPFVIAEAGVNHNGSLRRALQLVAVAAAAGADAVKFQSFKAEKVAAASAPKARYQQRAAGTASGQLEMLRMIELSPEAHRRIMACCRRCGIEFLSTPFDEDSADLLARLGVRMFKIPSGEITNTALLAHIARKGRPVLLSTGMCTLAEVAKAVQTIRASGRPPLALLHCVSSYPARPQDANLRAMETMARRFRLPVGYSDHTPGIAVAVAAAALGAMVIEKHFTLDKTLPGPDHRMSLDPQELKALVAGVREATAALGDGVKAPKPCEQDVRRVARRSLVLVRDMPSGTRLTAKMITAKRPGTGIPPTAMGRVIGKRLRQAVLADTLLRWGMFV